MVLLIACVVGHGKTSQTPGKATGHPISQTSQATSSHACVCECEQGVGSMKKEDVHICTVYQTENPSR